MDISIAEAHNRLSSLLRQLENGPIVIRKRGKSVGVLISPEEYENLRKVQAYLQIMEISHQVGEGATADEIYQASRQDLVVKNDR
ncbi:MAG: hypothetical protein A2Z16_12220 [Chloroflexi bacterium RBG_16_54_18]|nr:MAG: hypothetical protein A2Z16_12220 [Chloroflexi bacterium RBG_16_54_18]